MSRGGLLRRFPVLGIRDFRLLLADRLIAPASVGFSIVGVSFAVLKATNSATDLSYVLAAQIAPSLVFALIGGVAADRFPPQRVIVAANLLMALGEGAFGLLVLTGRPSLWAMIGLELITGTGVAIFYPASQALLPRLVPRDLLQEASAISRLAMNSGQMAGAAVAGLLVAAAGAGWALLLCGIGMVTTVPLLLAIRGSRPVAAAGGRGAGGAAEHDHRTARGLVGVPLAHLAVGDRGAVLRGDDGLVRGILRARPGGGAGAPRRPGRLGRDHRGGRVRPDRGRSGIAAVHAAQAHAVRRAHRGRHRHIPALAGDGPAAGRGVRRVVRPRRVRRDDDGAVDGHDGAEHPVGHAGPGLLLRRPRLGHGDAGRRADRRPPGGRDRNLPRAVRGGRGDHRRLRASSHPPRHPHHTQRCSGAAGSGHAGSRFRLRFRVLSPPKLQTKHRCSGFRRSSGTSGTSPRTRPRTPPRGRAARRSAPRSRPSRGGRRPRCGRSAPPS